MRKFFAGIKEKLTGGSSDEDMMEDKEGYVELNASGEEVKSKVIVRPFVIETFEDVKQILDALREGSTIALINIKPLKDTDLVELKRAINKLKKTCDAIEGEIAGFGEDWIVVVPSFASIYKSGGQTSDVKEAEESAQEE
jgi:SepF-like predicted cell division protein (DUF552 family)